MWTDKKKKAGSGRWDREKMQKTHPTSHVNEPIPHPPLLRVKTAMHSTPMLRSRKEGSAGGEEKNKSAFFPSIQREK